MAILESGEMYLETILVLSKNKSDIRSIDVVERMGYSKPSVSRAMGILKGNGLIEISKEGHISLTENGRSKAEKIYERHTILTNLLTSLGVDSKTAAEDACRIEHYISDKSIEAIKKHMNDITNAD